MFLNKFRKKCLFWRLDVYVTFGGSSPDMEFFEEVLYKMGFFEEVLYKTSILEN